MKNQFFYTRVVRMQEEGTENIIETRYRDSFNLDMVIRSVTLATGEVAVLLNDIHEQTSQEPIINTHTNKVKGYKDVKSAVQSEIHLSVEDGARFFNVTSVDNTYYASVEAPRFTSADEERREILMRSDSYVAELVSDNNGNNNE